MTEIEDLRSRVHGGIVASADPVDTLRTQVHGVTAAVPGAPGWKKAAGAVGKALGHWDDSLHPRGKNGRFIEKGGAVEVSSASNKPRRGKAVGVRQGKAGNELDVEVEYDDGSKQWIDQDMIEAAAPSKARLSGPIDDELGGPDDPTALDEPLKMPSAPAVPEGSKYDYVTADDGNEITRALSRYEALSDVDRAAVLADLDDSVSMVDVGTPGPGGEQDLIPSEDTSVYDRVAQALRDGDEDVDFPGGEDALNEALDRVVPATPEAPVVDGPDPRYAALKDIWDSDGDDPYGKNLSSADRDKAIAILEDIDAGDPGLSQSGKSDLTNLKIARANAKETPTRYQLPGLELKTRYATKDDVASINGTDVHVGDTIYDEAGAPFILDDFNDGSASAINSDGQMMLMQRRTLEDFYSTSPDEKPAAVQLADRLDATDDLDEIEAIGREAESRANKDLMDKAALKWDGIAKVNEGDVEGVEISQKTKDAFANSDYDQAAAEDDGYVDVAEAMNDAEVNGWTPPPSAAPKRTAKKAASKPPAKTEAPDASAAAKVVPQATPEQVSERVAMLVSNDGKSFDDLSDEEKQDYIDTAAIELDIPVSDLPEDRDYAITDAEYNAVVEASLPLIKNAEVETTLDAVNEEFNGVPNVESSADADEADEIARVLEDLSGRADALAEKAKGTPGEARAQELANQAANTATEARTYADGMDEPGTPMESFETGGPFGGPEQDIDDLLESIRDAQDEGDDDDDRDNLVFAEDLITNFNSGNTIDPDDIQELRIMADDQDSRQDDGPDNGPLFRTLADMLESGGATQSPRDLDADEVAPQTAPDVSYTTADTPENRVEYLRDLSDSIQDDPRWASIRADLAAAEDYALGVDPDPADVDWLRTKADEYDSMTGDEQPADLAPLFRQIADDIEAKETTDGFGQLPPANVQYGSMDSDDQDIVKEAISNQADIEAEGGDQNLADVWNSLSERLDAGEPLSQDEAEMLNDALMLRADALDEDNRPEAANRVRGIWDWINEV